MKLITKNIYYAIKSILYMTRKPDMVISVPELVHAFNMHRAFLRKILQILSKHKILKSLKGKGGGFILNIQPSQLRVLDIIKIFRGKVDIINCLLEKDVCPHPDDCVLMAKMKAVEKKLYSALETITIAALLQSTDKKL